MRLRCFCYLFGVSEGTTFHQHYDPSPWACERRIGCGSGQKLLEFATHGQNIFGQDHTPLRRSLDIVLKWQKDGRSRSGGCSVAAIILSLLESRVGKSQRNLNVVRKHTCRWHSGSYELLCQRNIQAYSCKRVCKSRKLVGVTALSPRSIDPPKGTYLQHDSTHRQRVS